MPAKLLLQLRLLNPCLPVNSLPPAALRLGLGPGPRASLSSSALTFSLALPFRLKHHRRFATRSDRSRSDFSTSRSSKSLVDDEAELSAWMTGLGGDKPDRDLGGRSGRGSKRTRIGESDSDDFDGFSERRTGPGSSVGPLSRTSPPPRRQMDPRRTGRFDSERDGNGNRSTRSREDGHSFSRKRPMDARQGNEKPGSFSRDSQMSRRFDSKRGEGNGEYLARKSIPRFQDGKLENSKGRSDSRKRVALLSEDDDDDDDDGVVGVVNKLAIGDLLSDDESDEVEDDEDEDIGNVIPKGNAKAPVRASSPGDSESYLSDTRFDQCSVSPLSLKAIKDAGYVKMTVVQEATLSVILKGKDVLAKAKTGTGKTVAFLLPSIEVVVNSPPAGRDQKRPPILVLVMCPTRELACQASTEANSLLKYHPTIGVQVVIGGTRLALEQKRLQANPCQILVATPGRLRDHIENTAGFATRLMGVKVLVLDEADHMLDMGFRKDIERIIASVPKQRQTLLFSATVPEEVRQVCHIALKRDHEFINTVQGGSEDTHSQVKQKHLIAPSDKQFALLYTFLKEHIADDVDYKVIVFCTTAMLTKLVAEFLCELKMNVREIHSRKSQSYRTKVSDEFRKSKGLILVTSDVSARGVDYPDVTLVIQLGLPGDKQQYIHRLGRTGRKGKEGEGLLLLAPWEEFFLSTIKDLPVTKATEPSVDPDTKKKVERALSNVEMKSKEAAYQAWLGYYNSNKTVGRDKYKLVELANEFSRSMGLDNPPAIPKLVLGKMGLKNIPGLRVK